MQGEFTSDAVRHVCQWMKVELNHGPTDHTRSQVAVERCGTWLHGILSELCKLCPRMWDHYVDPTLCTHRATPSTTLPSNPTGHDPRTQLDAVSPVAETEAMSLDNSLEERKQKFK